MGSKKEKLLVKRNGKGLGVYAGRLYKRGEIICIMKGDKESLRSVYSDIRYAKEPIDYPLQIGRNLYLNMHKPFVYINHSCDPNAGIKNISTLFALEDIEKGEEITFDYSTTIDESLRCKCGSKKCRGVVIDFFALPEKIQKYYHSKGALPSFIKRKYRKYNGK